jgi:hypothetical protein
MVFTSSAVLVEVNVFLITHRNDRLMFFESGYIVTVIDSVSVSRFEIISSGTSTQERKAATDSLAALLTVPEFGGQDFPRKHRTRNMKGQPEEVVSRDCI